MLFRDEVGLIHVATSQNATGQFIQTQTLKEVIANKKSVRQSEFYQALASNLRPELMFEVRYEEYTGQKRLGHKAKTATAGAGTTTTIIKLTAHGLKVGDVILNTTVLTSGMPTQRQVATVVDANTITVTAITGMAQNNVIKWYRKNYEIIRTHSKNEEMIELICQEIVLGG